VIEMRGCTVVYFCGFVDLESNPLESWNQTHLKVEFAPA